MLLLYHMSSIYGYFRVIFEVEMYILAFILLSLFVFLFMSYSFYRPFVPIQYTLFIHFIIQGRQLLFFFQVYLFRKYSYPNQRKGDSVFFFLFILQKLMLYCYILLSFPFLEIGNPFASYFKDKRVTVRQSACRQNIDNHFTTIIMQPGL